MDSTGKSYPPTAPRLCSHFTIGRCKLHGGMSTGPRTEEAASASPQRRRWEKYRAEKSDHALITVAYNGAALR